MPANKGDVAGSDPHAPAPSDVRRMATITEVVEGSNPWHSVGVLFSLWVSSP